MKTAPTVENIRNHRHLRNTANKIITKERFVRKNKLFEEELSDKQKWKKAKMETGQTKHMSPSSLREGQKVITKPREIAATLNRLYISTIRDTIREHKHKKNCLNLGIARKGGGGFQACPNCLEHFFMDRGNCLIFFLLEYYRGITGVLCVISLQFIGFSLNKHSIEIWNIWGKVLLGCPNYMGGGVPLIWAMPKFKQFFYVCAP